MPFPGPPARLPAKDEMADYLEHYAAHFQLPVMHDVRVDRLTREGNRYVARAGTREFEGDQVVVAMTSYQGRKVPAFARELSPDIVQLHSIEYRGLSQLEPGPVPRGRLATGAEVEIEARDHETWFRARPASPVAGRGSRSAIS
jgi:putative flavoprotein involved in K+ transport